MRISIVSLAALWLLIGSVSTAVGQFDTDGPNAVFRLQQMTPSVADPTAHNVNVFVPGPFDIDIESNANPNAPLILLGSVIDPTGSVFPVPWGGSVDIGVFAPSVPMVIDILGDGINLSSGPLDGFFATDSGDLTTSTPPRFDFDLTASAGLAGSHYALQAIVEDPTQPFFLDMTEAVDANFVAGQILPIQTGSLGSVNVGFLAGRTFNFHGVAYTSVWIGSKGILSFGTATSYSPPGFNTDTVAFALGTPSIAAWVADWQNQAGMESLLYEEIGNSVRIAFGDPAVDPTGIDHFLGNDSNNFEVRLELSDPLVVNPLEGEFTVDILVTDPTATSQNGDGIIGHTPGGALLAGTPGDLDLHSSQIVGPGLAQLEEHDASGTANSLLGFDGMGTPRAYSSMHSWNAQSVTFVPNPWVFIPGDAGYTSQPSAPALDDFLGADVASLDAIGAETVNLVGKFLNFNDGTSGLGGSVIFDPNGIALPGTVIGIFDGSNTAAPALANNPATSPFRNGEGLQIVTPAFTAAGFMPGPIDVQVTFNSGTVITKTLQLATATSLFTSYPLSVFSNANSQSQLHNLTANTINYYGVSYSSFWISRYGYITFGSAILNFEESIPEVFAGLVVPPTVTPNPLVAVIYSDLNNPANAAATFEVTEDLTLGSTMVEFKNQDHWDTQSPAGSASVCFGCFGPGSITFDLSNYLADVTPASNNHDLIIGITDGDDTVGPDTDLSDGLGTGISNVLGTYSSTMAPDSILELIPIGTQPALSLWTALETGSGAAVPFGTFILF
ncbi:MAG: hypothetical protein V3W41_12495 [Planctomycetota bacterium]